MPFTLAHPIATLPLWWASKKQLDLPALIVGATIPDIAYFIALSPVSNVGHSALGILTEGIPSALLLLFLGRYLLWQPVLALLPNRIACRLPIHCPYRFLPTTRLLVIVLSIAIGALTHILWDSFTHEHGWAVERLSFLSAEIATLPIYKWLQYSGGLIGVALLAILLLQAIRKSPSRYQPRPLSRRWKSIAVSFVAIVLMLTVYSAIATLPDRAVSAVIVHAVIGSISGLFLGLFLYAAAFWSSSLLDP